VFVSVIRAPDGKHVPPEAAQLWATQTARGSLGLADIVFFVADKMTKVIRFLVVVVCVFPAVFAGEDTRIGYPALDVFHLQAISIVLPDYPASSVAKHHTGTAVVELLVSTEGKVSRVDVLESPDAAINAAVAAAAARWTFHPLITRDNVSHPMKGRLIFYFRIVNGKPKVIDAIAAKLATAEHKASP
jgi:TonB family protein